VTAARMRQRPGPPDAEESIAVAMLADADPWPEADVVDTAGPRDVAVRQALALVRPQPAERPWLPRRPLLAPD
jgi:predicted kinase